MISGNGGTPSRLPSTARPSRRRSSGPPGPDASPSISTSYRDNVDAAQGPVDDDPDADEGDLLLRDSDAGSAASSRVPTPLPGEGFSFTRSRPTSPLGREVQLDARSTKRGRVLKLAVGVVLGIGVAWVS
jgi:hypothetical protein